MNGTPEIQPAKPSEVAQTLIFKTIWDRMPCRSFVSGLWLRSYANTPLFMNCFLNVLPIEKYRYFKFYFGNIIMVTPTERALYLQCTAESLIQYALDIEERSRGKQTANWEAVKELKVELIKQYKKSFPNTKGMFINYQYNIHEIAKIVGKLNQDFWQDYNK